MSKPSMDRKAVFKISSCLNKLIPAFLIRDGYENRKNVVHVGSWPKHKLNHKLNQTGRFIHEPNCFKVHGPLSPTEEGLQKAWKAAALCAFLCSFIKLSKDCTRMCETAERQGAGCSYCWFSLGNDAVAKSNHLILIKPNLSISQTGCRGILLAFVMTCALMGDNGNNG